MPSSSPNTEILQIPGPGDRTSQPSRRDSSRIRQSAAITLQERSPRLESRSVERLENFSMERLSPRDSSRLRQSAAPTLQEMSPRRQRSQSRPIDMSPRIESRSVEVSAQCQYQAVRRVPGESPAQSFRDTIGIRSRHGESPIQSFRDTIGHRSRHGESPAQSFRNTIGAHSRQVPESPAQSFRNTIGTHSRQVPESPAQSFRNTIGTHSRQVLESPAQSFRNTLGTHSRQGESPAQSFRNTLGTHSRQVPESAAQSFRNTMASHSRQTESPAQSFRNTIGTHNLRNVPHGSPKPQASRHTICGQTQNPLASVLGSLSEQPQHEKTSATARGRSIDQPPPLIPKMSHNDTISQSGGQPVKYEGSQIWTPRASTRMIRATPSLQEVAPPSPLLGTRLCVAQSGPTLMIPGGFHSSRACFLAPTC